jgi:hypothetical protein
MKELKKPEVLYEIESHHFIDILFIFSKYLKCFMRSTLIIL